MATMINELCVNCGACEPVCPGDGIFKNDSTYVIDPDSCTECVGFYAQEQCRLVCPVDNCCVRDPERIETEEVLFERAQKNYSPGDELEPVLTSATSHFRVGSLPWWKRLMLNV